MYLQTTNKTHLWFLFEIVDSLHKNNSKNNLHSVSKKKNSGPNIYQRLCKLSAETALSHPSQWGKHFRSHYRKDCVEMPNKADGDVANLAESFCF